MDTGIYVKSNWMISDFTYIDHTKSQRKFERKIDKICYKCNKVISGKAKLSRHIEEVHEVETRVNISKQIVNSYPYQFDECNLRRRKQIWLKN